MTEHLPPPRPPPPPPPAAAPAAYNNPDPTRYWCYQCDKRVPVETVPNNPNHGIICYECKNGFVESINEETPAFSEFVQILRLIAQAARDDDAPPPPPSDHPAGDDDYFRIELDGYDNGNYVITDDEEREFRDQVRDRWYYDDDDDDDNDDNNNNNIDDDDDDDNDNNNNINDDDDDDNNDINEHEEEVIENLAEEETENRIEEDDEFVTRDRHDVLRLRLREVGNRADNRRNRILDWAEMLIGLEDQSIEFRLRVSGGDHDAFTGNPGDYVDADGYEALLQTLADSDSSRRGAPPAARLVVDNLCTVGVESVKLTDIESEICAVCKENVFNNEGKHVNQLECGHMYHGECIVPWLGVRNTCPVCRFELPTDDPEYEEDRKRRLVTMGSSSGAGG